MPASHVVHSRYGRHVRTTWMGDSLYAAKTGIKEIWHVEGATHADSYLKYAKEYTEIVKSFVERYNIPKI